jgi:dethiobiotin synthetase
VLVVTRPELGTLNATALTVTSIRSSGLTVEGLVVNRMPAQPGLTEATNLEELPALCRAAVVGVVPELGEWSGVFGSEMAVPAGAREALVPLARKLVGQRE